MKTAPIHSREFQRIQSLKSANLLDSPSEIKFDFITQMALDICETSIALISLVDEERQYFKSKIGLDVESTPRQLAFCAHAILQDEIFEVSNALNDDRFFDNPLVLSAPNIRFYAGVPVIWKDNLPLGTLCVIDTEPKTLSQHQKDCLKYLAASVSQVITIREEMAMLQMETLELAKKEIDLIQKRKTFLNEINKFKKAIR